MGNTVSGSKDRHSEETVDFGFLSPRGVYTGAQDWNQQVVGNLIVDRKLAPFHRPLEDYDESWDDEQILAARKELPNAPPAAPPDPPPSAGSTSSKFHRGTSNKTGKEPFRPTEASVYRGAVECPICFLYYPPNINRSRCCDQSICTECFVQIKRAEPTTTHLVSEPAACPYCVQDNFGVTYEPPSWRAGLVRDGQQHYTPNVRPDMSKSQSSASTDSQDTKRRRKSFGADSPEVVTIDQIRPDWEAKLAAVRAAVTRRANRRIIMRQIGDRLIPIGVTSGRMVAGDEGGAESTEGGGGRRRRRNHGGQDLSQLLGSMGGVGGQDLEEIMLMEAMRLSLLEHEEQQRRQNAINSGRADINGIGNTASPPAHRSNIESTDTNSNDNMAPPAHSSSPETSPGTSPRQSLTTSGIPSRSSSLLGPSPLGDRRSRPSSPSSQRSTLTAALAAAQTPSAFFGPQPRSREQNTPIVEGDATPHASRSSTPDPAATALTTTPRVHNSPLALDSQAPAVGVAGDEAALSGRSSSPSLVMTSSSPSLVTMSSSPSLVTMSSSPSLVAISSSPSLPMMSSSPSIVATSSLPSATASSSPSVVATPPTPPRTPGAEDAESSTYVSEEYAPLASSTEMSDPLLKWENK